MKKTALAIALVATLTGCQNWGGYAGAGTGALAGNALGRATGINPTLAALAGAAAGGMFGDRLVSKWRLKDLPPSIDASMQKLIDKTHEAFTASMKATKAADDAELASRASPDDSGLRANLRAAAGVERDKWNAYTRHRDQFVNAIRTAEGQGYDAEKYHGQAAELLTMEQPVYQHLINRRL